MFKKYERCVGQVEKIEAQLKSAREAVSDLQRKVSQGELKVSHNPYENFLFVHLSPNSDDWGQFLELREQLMSGKDREILVELKDTRTEGGIKYGEIPKIPLLEKHISPPEMNITYTTINAYYGVLTGKDFGYDVETGSLRFPVGRRHTKFSVENEPLIYSPDLRLELFNSPLDLKLNELPHLGQRGNSSMDLFLGLSKENRSSQILIGEGVKEYFKNPFACLGASEQFKKGYLEARDFVVGKK